MSHGSAVGAVLSGFFAAAGAYAGVLWGPVTIVVGGVGVGARAFDGRLMQPGEGAKRPRGFQDGEDIPLAARVAATNAVSACLVAHAYAGGERLAGIIKPGIVRARQSGAEARAELLGRIRAAGAGALSDAHFVREVLKVAGPVAGGLLGPQDFEASAQTIDQPVVPAAADDDQWCKAPWEGDAEEVPPGLGHGHAVIAVDVRGVAAALTFRRITEGLSVPALDLELPTLAVPVQRGVPRVAPGTRLKAPSPIGISMQNGAALKVIADPAATRLGGAAGAPLCLVRDPQTRQVSALAGA